MEEDREMKDTIILYPSPGIGHLISMVELGKRFLLLNPPFSITILITQASFNTGSTSPYIQAVQSSFPSISFHQLPSISFPLHSSSSSSPHHEALIFHLLRLNNPLVHQFLLPIASSVRSLIFDFFCHPVLSLTTPLHIPSYCFYTSPASTLAIFLYTPTIHRLTSASFKDLGDTLFHCPGVPPVPASDMPLPIQDREDDAYHDFLSTARAFPRASGIIINTFESLEPRAVKALRSEACIPDGRTPPVYCIGPLTAETGGWSRMLGVARLAAEPKRRVLVLWELGGLLRAPAQRDCSRVGEERAKGRGLVVKSWAPQVDVLSHDSVGGFVTHCGWNSVLEALCAGVPMVAWPLYAEQRQNRLVMVKEMRLALPVEEGQAGWVAAEEVERRVRELMESEEGKALREGTVEMKEEAMKPWLKAGHLVWRWPS
ncbi:UDP-glycosyltransferase 88A1 [Cinnamomum micranthum f. kanehirae]|uniref:Glycosyltransferase n=1 Tax=Cinnamomum micranthum f. kanehirae TaxID=337451 RepID=A0A3S3Q0J8_9MAGN|nr:UDP-glycosyltransferase 88A1 [Cinnamomum micranthum f. kanehirae]